jgi:hypothetical protein
MLSRVGELESDRHQYAAAVALVMVALMVTGSLVN